MSKETIKIVEINTDPAKKSIKDLRKELLELKNQMANLEEGGDEFLEIANKAGELKHQLDEINESVKGASADFGDMVGNISNVAAGLVGAFSAIQGGLQAMGVESEAIDETIKRMQGLMAVVQGLSQIDTAIKSMDKLRKSITATTGAAKLLKAALQPKIFLAISAAVSGLFLIFNKLKSKQEEVIAVQEEYNRKIQEEARTKREKAQQEYLGDLQNEYDLKVKIGNILNRGDDLKTQTALLEEYKGKLSEAQNQYNSYYESIKSVRNLHKDKTDDEFVDFFYGKDSKPLREKIALYTDLVKKSQTAVENLTAIAEAEAKIAPQLAAEERAKAAKADAKAAAERKKNYDDEVKTIEYLIRLYEELYAEDNIKFKEEELNLAERSLANIKSYFGETSQEYKDQLKIVLDLRKAYEELTKVKEEPVDEEKEKLEQLAEQWKVSIQTPQEWYNQELAILNTLKEQKLLTDEEYIRASKQLYQEFADWQKELDNEVLDSKKEKAFLIAQLAASAFNAIGSIMSELASNEDVETKESFEKQKKLQIGAATMSMLTGIINAWTSAMALPSPWNVIQGAIDTAATLALGTIQITKIKQQQFGGGSATPSSSAVNATIVPPVQYSNAVQGAELNGNIQNTKVYVLESDVVDTIGKVQTQESENTY